MALFDDIQDVEAWLAPLGYAALFAATAPFGIFDAEDRAHYDRVVANGVPYAQVTDGLKVVARLALTEQLELRDRVVIPPRG